MLANRATLSLHSLVFLLLNILFDYFSFNIIYAYKQSTSTSSSTVEKFHLYELCVCVYKEKLCISVNMVYLNIIY